MFYAHFVLSKKGPLAKIWLAAHWDKKLTKAHVFETNIEGSVEAIIQPKAKLALRTSGHLLLGVVRIYSRKAKYLLADCNEAFVKIKMAFRPGMVDLPEENREAALSAITLPEAFHEFDTAMADLSDLEVQTQFAVNQSRPEEITMREDLGSITLIGDDGFGDMGFDSSLLDDSQLEETLFAREPADFATLAMMAMKESKEAVQMETTEDEAVAASNMEEDNYEGPAGVDDDYDSNDGGHYSPAGDAELFTDSVGGEVEREVGGLFEDPVIHEESSGQPIQSDFLPPAPFLSPSHKQSLQAEPSAVFTLDPSMPQLDREAPIVNHTSPVPLPSNEPETFTLKPVDVVAIGPERKYRKKRKLVVDDQKAIASETMKLQLSDTSEIITTLDLAPPTKKLMHWKETGGVDKLTIFPCRPIVSKKLSKLFSSNLVMKHTPEKPQDSTLADSRDEGHQEVKRSSDKIEVRNTVGADGMPRLVFAVKKHLILPTPTEEAPHHQESADDSSTFKVPSPPPLPSNDSLIRKESLAPSVPSTTPRHINETSLDELPVNSTLDPFIRRTPERTPLYGKQPEHIVTNNNDYDDNDDNDIGGAYDGYDDDYQEANNEMEVDYQDHNGDEIQRKVEEEDNEDDDGDDEDDGQAAVEGEEMTEEAEENRWNKKSQQVLHSFNRLISRKDQVGFKEMFKKCNRKQVASKFYSLLVLKKTQMIDVYQPEPYSDVILTRGPLYAKMAG